MSCLSAGALDNMDEDTTNAVFNDMDFYYNKVKCPKIEQMMPRLMKMMESEMEGMRQNWKSQEPTIYRILVSLAKPGP